MASEPKDAPEYIPRVLSLDVDEAAEGVDVLDVLGVVARHAVLLLRGEAQLGEGEGGEEVG